MRVAVVGSGIAGMTAAWLLSDGHDVDVFESQPVLGGHTRTVDITVDGKALHVDTGFMVFNERTYPNLVGLLHHLQIESRESDMSFSVSCGEEELEWSSVPVLGLVAHPSNIFRSELWRMVFDIVRLSASAERLLAEVDSDDITLGEMLQREGYSSSFIDLYLIPMVSAIWSTPEGDMLSFPARTFLRFADNHGLLHIAGKPTWRTIPGGARRYIDALAAEISGTVTTGVGAGALRRTAGGPLLTLTDGSERTYDHVVLACHAPQSLAVLTDPTPAEEQVLGAFAYQPNEAILHTDASLLPTRRLARASWNYYAGSCDVGSTELSVTYDLDRLQGHDVDSPVLLTLNAVREPGGDHVLRRIDFEHPMFDTAAIEAQRRIPEIQGTRNTWYCGAWQRYGFHEDGLLSALSVAGDFGIRAPWVTSEAGAAALGRSTQATSAARQHPWEHPSPRPDAELA